MRNNAKGQKNLRCYPFVINAAMLFIFTNNNPISFHCSWIIRIKDENCYSINRFSIFARSITKNVMRIRS